MKSLVHPGRFDVLSSALWHWELGWKVDVFCLQKKVTAFKLPTRHCLQILRGFKCPVGPELSPPLWRGCYSKNHSLSVLKSHLLPVHPISSIKDWLAYSGIRNITDKYKECVCLSLSRERFSENLMFISGVLCAQGMVGKPEMSQDNLG